MPTSIGLLVVVVEDVGGDGGVDLALLNLGQQQGTLLFVPIWHNNASLYFVDLPVGLSFCSVRCWSNCLLPMLVKCYIEGGYLTKGAKNCLID